MFSVIVPTYNRVALLERTLESLFRQEHAEFEVIVANDGSSDGTDAYLSRLASEGRITYVAHRNSGLAATRKAGLARAKGELIAFTDDDCILPTDWLRRLGSHFLDPSVAGVGGATKTGNPGNHFAVTNDLINNYFKSVLHARSGAAPYLTGNNIAYRKSALDRVGGPDPRFRMGAEDRDLVYRVARSGGRLVYDPSIVIGHFNDADFPGFVRHQFRQGNGSYLFYTESGRDSSRPGSIPVGAYFGLFAEPFRLLPFGTAVFVAFLIVLAQAAVTAGFASALLKPREQRR
jgi:cellulose synthase/poly-beta-1,6-N-acetylglucosamine synthase-like glycosyltransferase